MSQEWYIHQDGQQKGPYPWEQVWQLARSGALKPEDLVWTDGMGDWVPAGQVTGLTAIPPSATVPPPPPPIGAGAPPVGSPPAPAGPHRGAPARARTWWPIAAFAGAIVLVMGACLAAYLLFLRDRGLPASPAATTALPPASTSTTVPLDRSDREEETAEATVDSEEPTEPVAVDLGDEPTVQPTLGATPEPTVVPTKDPTVEPTVDRGTEQPPPESPTEPAGAGDGDQPALPSPRSVVEEFILVTLGTVPRSAVDYDRARVLMTVAYASEFDSPAFVPLTYGIQDGPTSYEIAAEETAGSTATVQVLGFWGADLGREWRFVLQQEAGLWRVAGIEVVDAVESTGGDEAQSRFWQLNPVLEEFTVDQQGSWKLVVAFDQPVEDTGADFRIEYRREDDGSVAYSQESSGVIEAGRVRLTLDSDWTSYDLYQLGFRPGKHRVVAYIDGVEIAVGAFVVN